MTGGGGDSLKAALCVAILFGVIGVPIFLTVPKVPLWIFYVLNGAVGLKALIDLWLGWRRRRNGPDHEIC